MRADERRALSVSAAHIGQRYRVIEQLGRGGMAIVYRVRDLTDQRELALKTLDLRGSERDRATRAQFEREFYVLAQLSHPSVIEVYDYGIGASGPFYTMELLDGGDLVSRAPRPYVEACALMVQVCSSLSLLHSRKLVHRDISPRNVRCTRDGRAKLIDFGAMVPLGHPAEKVGTPGFAAPEVVQLLPNDARTDLFSLGATLYFSLTGKKPFPARTLSDHSEYMREDPLPPSSFAPEIPDALDALVLSLLHVDPVRRPSSAFEVMQRLAAIANLPHAESEEVAQFYLSAPTLIGRETEQRRFRQHLHRASQGHGGGLIFTGDAGSGRSRLLDTCALEAKLTGAHVVKLSGRAASATPLAAAHRIASDVLAQLPHSAADAARQLGERCATVVALNGSDQAQIRPLETWQRDRSRAGAELRSWLQAICHWHTLVIELDDVERLDVASLSWLAAIAHDASELRLLIAASTTRASEHAHEPVLAMLQSRAVEQTIAPLSAEQTETLVRSIFNDAPHAALVSHRIHRIAGGNPRESIVLARDLLSRGLIRYAGGGWSLPAELTDADLPTSIEAVVRKRIDGVPAFARRIAEAQALAFEGPWTRADYAQLVGEAHRHHVARALETLVNQGILANNGSSFTLGHVGVRQCLLQELSHAERARRHAELADFYAASGRSGAIEFHHRMSSGATARALDELFSLLQSGPSLQQLCDTSKIDRKTLAGILEQARMLAVVSRRPAREVHELNQRLLELSASTDDSIYVRYAPGWLAQLELDSGARDYREADTSLPSPARLARARAAADERYHATPERDRVYRSGEALRSLAYFVSISNSIATRRADTRLAEALAGMLDSFVEVAPIFDVIRDMAIAARDLNSAAQPERARARMRTTFERLQTLENVDFPYFGLLRFAAAQMVAVAEVHLGLPSAEQWIDHMEGQFLYGLGALHLRRVLYIFDGDHAGAERCRRDAELLAIQTDGVGFVPARLELELVAYHHARDLAGVKHVADRLEQLTRRAVGWQAMHQYALGVFQWLRGDLAGATALLESALRCCHVDQVDPPPHLNAWVHATAALVTVLAESGQAHDAHTRGLAFREQARAIELPLSPALEHALALAETKLGAFAAAAARLDALIAVRGHLRASFRAADYEARARVAFAAGDAAAAERFVLLAAEQHASLSEATRLARLGRLLDEARLSGIPLDLQSHGVRSSSVPGAPPPADPRLEAFEQLGGAEVRAVRALELLMTAARARGGHFYAAEPGRLRCTARAGDAPDDQLDAFVQRYLQQRLESEAMTTVFTEYDEPAEPSAGTWHNQLGAVYQLTLLRAERDDACVGLVALTGMAATALDPDYAQLSAAISAKLVAAGDVRAF